MKIKSFLFFYLTINCLVQAQTNSVDQIFDSTNSYISTHNKGTFETDFIFKSAAREDTSSFSGKVYFFKNACEPDTFGQFIVFKENAPWKAYDGHVLYTFDHSNKMIFTKFIINAGKETFYRNRLDEIAYERFIYCSKPAFKIEDYQKDEFDSIRVDNFLDGGYTSVVVTIFGSHINEVKTFEKDPDMATFVIKYFMSLPNFALYKRQEWAYFWEKPQYKEHNFSAIQPIHDSVNFNNKLRLDSFEMLGYTFKKEEDHLAKLDLQSKLLIEPGFQLVPIELLDYNNKIVQIPDSSHQLIVLDFWYQSCYPCLKALPAMERLYQKYSNKGVAFYGVNGTDKDPDKMKKFLLNRDIHYPTLMDTEKALSKKYNIYAYPLMVVLNAKTNIVLEVHVGYSDELEEKLSQTINDHLRR